LTAEHTTTSGRDTMRHASIYSGAAMLGRLVGFIMLPFYAHLLRGNGYAVIGMIDVGIALLVTLLGYGLSGAIILHYHEEKDPERKRRVVSTGVIVATVASFALVLLPMILARPVSSLLLDDANLSHLLIMGLIGFVFEMAGQAASSWLLIRSRSVVFAAVNLVRLFVSLSLNILFIVVLNWGLNGYFISSLVTALLTNSVFVMLAARDCGWAFDREIARAMRKFMVPLMPGNVVSFVSRQVERVLVKFQVDLTAVGILEMGYKFPILIHQIITTPYMQSWGPRRFEMAERPEAPRQLGRMFTYYLFLATYVGLVMAVTIKPVLIILTPPEFHLSYRIAQLEIFTLILQGCEGHLNFGLFYAKHTSVITKLRTVTALMKIPLAYMFVSIWSIYGAAFSAAIMSIVSLVFSYHLSQKRYQIRIEWVKVSVLAGAAITIFAVVRLWDVTRLPGFSFISADLTSWIANVCQSTFIGSWRDGVLVKTLREDSRQVAEIMINGSVAMAYGLLLPWVRDESLLGSNRALLQRFFPRPERLRRDP
jgi:O-antigen/teichoic acid export membrane protein